MRNLAEQFFYYSTIDQTGTKALDLGYSRKIRTRYVSACDRSQLVISGNGSLHGSTLKACHLPDLPNFPLSSGTNPLEVANFNQRLPQVVEALLTSDKYAPEEEYVAGIGEEDLNNFPSIAVDIAKDGGIKSGTVYRAVFGASTEISVRALSYLLPPLLQMDKMKKAGVIPPQFQLIFANHIGTFIKGLGYEKVRKQAANFTSISKEYIKQFFPELTTYVVFLEDTPIEEGAPLKNELDYAKSFFDQAVTDDVKAELSKKEGNVNGSSHTYASAHVLMHDIDLGEGLKYFGKSNVKRVTAKNIISVGGVQERLFYRVRQQIKPHLDKRYHDAKTLQFFTKHVVPPYLMAEEGDISLDDVLKGQLQTIQSNSGAVHYDLRYLREVTRSRGHIEIETFFPT